MEDRGRQGRGRRLCAADGSRHVQEGKGRVAGRANATTRRRSPGAATRCGGRRAGTPNATAGEAPWSSTAPVEEQHGHDGGEDCDRAQRAHCCWGLTWTWTRTAAAGRTRGMRIYSRRTRCSPTTKTPWTDDFRVSWGDRPRRRPERHGALHEAAHAGHHRGLRHGPLTRSALTGRPTIRGRSSTPDSLFLGLDRFGYGTFPESNFVIATLAGGARDYQGLELTFRQRLQANWQALAAYTYGRATGNTNSDFERRLPGRRHLARSPRPAPVERSARLHRAPVQDQHVVPLGRRILGRRQLALDSGTLASRTCGPSAGTCRSGSRRARNTSSRGPRAGGSRRPRGGRCAIRRTGWSTCGCSATTGSPEFGWSSSPTCSTCSTTRTPPATRWLRTAIRFGTSRPWGSGVRGRSLLRDEDEAPARQCSRPGIDCCRVPRRQENDRRSLRFP